MTDGTRRGVGIAPKNNNVGRTAIERTARLVVGVAVWASILCLFAVANAGMSLSAARGKATFAERCGLCHETGASAGGAQGPDLGGVVGRRAGSAEFGYSPALRRAVFSWNAAKLDRFLEDPGAAVPGTTMAVRVPNAADRRDLIGYLSSLRATTSAGPSPASFAAAAASTPARTPAALLVGRSAFGDWRVDGPGVRRRIRVEDLGPPYTTPSAHNSPRVIDAPDGATLQVPAGFAVTRFATGLKGPRMIRVAPNGDLFIAESAAGRIVILRARDPVAQPDGTTTFASGLDEPFGIAFYPTGPNPQWVYVANHNTVVRFPYRNGDLRSSGGPESIVASLAPTTGGHSTRDVAFSLDDQQMFVSVGSGTNVGDTMPALPTAERARWDADRGIGAAWGYEESRAGVLVFDVIGHHRHNFATGIRNCVGLAVHPRTGALWCATNERDGLGDDLPPDFVTRVRAGGFYGWPWYYLGAHEDPRHAGERPELAAQVTIPDVLIQPHSAPLGLAFYSPHPGAIAAFPADYIGDAFVALHGSWNRASRTGYKIVRIRLSDGVPTGDYEDFLTGFVLADDTVWGRPVGVAVAHDGALLVSDDGNGVIWRIAYLQRAVTGR